ncbi:MAG: ABC transporter permease [Treponema sp.]|nr:ABC transporter permease [Treponema sp.]
MAETTALDKTKILGLLKKIWDNYSIVLVTIAIVLVTAIFNPRILTVHTMLSIMRSASIVGIIALGMTFVIIAGGIDLSAGHVVAACGGALIILQRNPDLPLFVALFACIAVALVIGMINGTIITKANLPPFIVTLAIGIFFRSVTMHFLGGATVSGRNVPEFTSIGMGTTFGLPNAMVAFVIMAIILSFVLNYTKFGSYVYAAGGNENAARYSGINVHRVRIATYVLLGLCIGITTIFDLSRMAAVAANTSGLQYEFDAITAVVIGGTALSGGKGRMLGTVMGVFIIGMVNHMMVMMNISPFLAGAVKGTIILVAVLLQKQDK